MNNKVIIYNPDICIKDSLKVAFKETIKNVKNNKWLIWANFKKDFFSKYKQSGLGKFWAIILPIIPVSAYLFLGYVRVLNVKGGMPFPVYMIIGITFWQLLSGGIQGGMKAIKQEKNVINKINMPIIIPIISKYGNIAADTIIRIIFLSCVLFYYRMQIHWEILFLPIILIPLLLLCFGAGIILSVLNIVTNDVENIVKIAFTYGMWLSSVVFPMPTEGVLAKANTINIFNHLMVGIRDFIIFGHFRFPMHYLIASAVCVTIFIISIKVQHSLQYKIKGLL